MVRRLRTTASEKFGVYQVLIGKIQNVVSHVSRIFPTAFAPKNQREMIENLPEEPLKVQVKACLSFYYLNLLSNLSIVYLNFATLLLLKLTSAPTKAQRNVIEIVLETN